MGINLMRWLNFTESPKRTIVPKGAKTMAKTTCPRYALCGGQMARHTAPNQQPSPRKAPKGFVNLVVIIWEILESRGKRAESDTVTLVMITSSCVWVALVSLSLTFVNTFAICQMSPSLAPHGLCTHPLFISFNRACLKANSQLWSFALHSLAQYVPSPCCSPCSCLPASRQQRATASRLTHQFLNMTPVKCRCQRAR